MKSPSPNAPLYFAGQPGAGYGWGVCNDRLLAELSKKIAVEFMPLNGAKWNQKRLPGPMYNPIQSEALTPICPAKGTRTIGYTFFENLLKPESVANSKFYDFIFAGSTWNVEMLREAGIENCAALIQGVNHAVFCPAPTEKPSQESFTIFSGGKYELRKGQDLVLRAYQIMRARHPDVKLVAAWFNLWPGSVDTMRASPYLKHVPYDPAKGWVPYIESVCAANGIDASGIRILPLLPHEKMAAIYRKTDVGLFPNRCEGGTNLVLMEYMACGRPVIASNWTGHRDIVNPENALLLQSNREILIHDCQPVPQPLMRWWEASLEEIVHQLETAYQQRDQLRPLGERAGEFLKQFTWARSAQTLLDRLDG